MTFAGNVGREVWADRGAGSDLELKPFFTAARCVAVLCVLPGAKDEGSCKKGFLDL